MSKLVLVIGVPGSGKTTLSTRLAPMIPSLYLCSDTITDALFSSDRVSPDYVEMRPRIYASMYGVAEDNLRLGSSVLIDAPHLPMMIDEAWRDAIRGVADRAKAQLKVLRLCCSEGELRKRIERRGSARDAGKLTHWSDYLAENQIRYDVPVEHMDLNSERPFDAQLSMALTYIGAPDADRSRK